jgi:hypothetical protein
MLFSPLESLGDVNITTKTCVGVAVATGAAVGLYAYFKHFRVSGKVETESQRHGGELVMKVLKEHGCVANHTHTHTHTHRLMADGDRQRLTDRDRRGRERDSSSSARTSVYVCV